MSSTPTQSISIKSAARKLPIKRKSPDDQNNPNPNPNPTPFPKVEFEYDDEEEEYQERDLVQNLKPPPFKFHRIWTETDEIRFLQGLLDSASQGMIFPRDLHLFYNRFSNTMSQPYTKSQLSEKLRRLRKKFRVISSRISRGLDQSMLSSHDKSIFDLAKKLWDTDHSEFSPFNVNNIAVRKKAIAPTSTSTNSSTCVSVEVGFNPTFRPSMSSSLPMITYPFSDDHDNVGDTGDYCEFEINDNGGGHVEELRLKKNDGGNNGDGIRRIVGKTVLDVFEKSIEEVKLGFRDNTGSSSEQGKEAELMKRFREQSLSELDVLASRLRLVIENSVTHQ